MLGPRNPAVRMRWKPTQPTLQLPDPDSMVFPDGFHWGCSTASHQVEGMNNNSDWWRYERIQGNADNFFDFSEHVQNYKSDHRRQFQSDIGLMAEGLGLNSYRFSLEWSCTEPEEGRFDDEVIERYAAMCRLMRTRGIEPMACLFHWVSPDWIWDHDNERGTGWYHPSIVDRFARFAEKVIPTLSPHVNQFLTLNEPNVYLYGGYSEAVLCPGHTIEDEELVDVYRHLLQAHVAAWKVIKQANPDAEVGIANHISPFEPVSRWNPLEAWLAARVEQGFSWSFPDAVRDGRFTLGTRRSRFISEEVADLKGTVDFMGINYYQPLWAKIAFKPMVTVDVQHPYSDDMRIWPDQIYTAGFLGILEIAHERYELPTHVLENGRSHRDDNQRREYIRQHLATLSHGINNRGVDVRGYYYWSVLDNQEWGNGFVPRLGLYEVDYDTGERTLRDSGQYYGQVIRRSHAKKATA